MIVFFRIAVGLLFYCALPFLLLVVVLSGKHRQGLSQRLGFYPKRIRKQEGQPMVWLHASSVGEIQAARAVIGELKKRLPEAAFVVTTMTARGKEVAERQLDAAVCCFLAPLDVPFVIERSVKKIDPDIYICIETELWPLLLQKLSRQKVALYLVNGRMSEKSYRGYMRMRSLFHPVVQLFDRMVVISDNDRKKYLNLGADGSTIAVEGNVKYDLAIPDNSDEIVHCYRTLMKIGDEEVFVAGSTHTGEEELLLPLFKRLVKEVKILFIIAPRHVERIAELEKQLHAEHIDYHLLSSLHRGETRRHSLLLVDTMGELAQLYSVADYVFCGGSLVKRGGHNLMEAALWQKLVFYGPSIEDFRDAADLLEAAGAGFLVHSVEELEDRLRYFRRHRADYGACCRRAGEVARMQQGCSGRQIAYILNK